MKAQATTAKARTGAIKAFAGLAALCCAMTPVQGFGAGKTVMGQRVAATDTVSFTVYLPLQHRDQLDSDLEAMHTETSPMFHKWMKPAAFMAKYGASAAQVAKVQQQLAGYGLTATVSSARTLQVTGPAGAAEQVLGTTLKTATLASGKVKTVMAATAAPSGALAETGAMVTGLSPTLRMRPHIKHFPVPENRYSPVGGYWFDDLKQAYGWPTYQALTGKGVTIGILMSGGFSQTDMNLYFNHEKLASPAFTTVNVDGGSAFDPTNDGTFEAELDLQQSGGMAPKAAVTLYSIPDLYDSSIIDGLLQILSDNKADVVSMSFGSEELLYTAEYNDGVDYTYLLQIEDELYAQGNAQGITFIASSGDYGAASVPPLVCFDYGPNCGAMRASVSSPASDPHVVGVGGTNLVTTYTGLAGDLNSKYVLEEAFSDPQDGDQLYGTSATGLVWGSGGGTSIIYKKPLFQALTATGSAKFRTVPDVSLHMGGCPGGSILPCNPDDSYDLEVLGGYLYGVIGTSASAPDFAGLTALAIERLGTRLGNENYYLYGLALAQEAGLPLKVFRHNIAGDNGVYQATPGKAYNRVLGNGTVDGANFVLAPFTPKAGTPQTPSNP